MNYETLIEEIMLQAQQELTRMKKTTKLEEKIALSQIIKNLTDSYANIVESTTNMMRYLDDDFLDDDFPDEEDLDLDYDM
jgi:vacuolar-type H+-ATPase subunit E/Vma4